MGEPGWTRSSESRFAGGSEVSLSSGLAMASSAWPSLPIHAEVNQGTIRLRAGAGGRRSFRSPRPAWLRAVADQDRPILGLRGPEAVAPSDERRVERDHVEERPEAQLLGESAGERSGASATLDLRVEEQLARIVAGLAVDVHGPGVVGRELVVEPERDRRTRRRDPTGPRSRPIAGGRDRPRAGLRPSSSRATPGSIREQVGLGDVLRDL